MNKGIISVIFLITTLLSIFSYLDNTNIKVEVDPGKVYQKNYNTL